MTVNYGTHNVETETACESYTWHGETHTISGTYTYDYTNADGCASTDTLHLTINYGTLNVETETACESYTWHGETYTATGTYTYSYTNADGCPSVDTLHLTVNYGTHNVETETACESYTWHGETYTTSGTYTYEYTNADGCASTDTLHLTVNNPQHQSETVTAYDSYAWNGVNYTQSGNYTYEHLDDNGCEQVDTLHLTIHYSSASEFSAVACESYTWNDSVYTESGDYTQGFHDVYGADSVMTLHLTVNYGTHNVVTEIACDSYTWHGETYTASGTYTYAYTNGDGCPSVDTLHLTVNHPVAELVDTTVCDSYVWNGITYTQSGDYLQTFTAENGCDSVVTLHLTINNPVADTVEATACDSYDWNGTTYTQSGDYTHTFATASGCDSTVTLHLTVAPSATELVEVSIVQNNLPYHYVNGQIDTTFAIGTPPLSVINYPLSTASGCDSVVTLNLTVYQNVTSQVDTIVCAADLPYTWQGHSFTAAGTHEVTLLTSHGADSTVTYTLTVDNITVNIGNITHITCYGESTGAATVTVTGGQTPMIYQWTNASGASIATTTSISNQPASVYTFTVTDHLGCTAMATVTLNTLNDALQPGTIAEDQVVCEGEQPLLFTGTAASDGNDGAYQWQISSNGIDWTPAPGTNNAQTYNYPNPAATAFTLRRAWVSQNCGTVYSNTVFVEVAPNSSDTIMAEVCQGEPYQENGFDILVDQTAEAGEYMFEQHYATGHCDSAVFLLLMVNPVAAEFVEAIVCEGDGYYENGFSISSQETIGEREFTRVQILQTENGCDSVVQLTLMVIDTAIRIVPLTADFCDNMTMELMVETGMPDYLWSTGEQSPNITVTTPGYYSVTATQGDCSVSSQVMVAGCNHELILPNAITPSRSDGTNDYFCIPEDFLDHIALFEISIFNRWGEVVYYSTDKNFKWYGEYKDKIMVQNVFNYIIRYTDTIGRQQQLKGSITVL